MMAILPSDPKKQKQFMLALLPLLGAFAYWYVIHEGHVQENADLASRLETLQAQNDIARIHAMNSGPELQQKLDQYRAHIERLELLIPKSEEVPQLLNDMTVRARESGVELVLLQPEAQVPGPFYTRQVYEVSVLGAYHDVGRFLTAVGSLPRIVTPTGLRLVTRGRDPRTGNVQLEAMFRIETYVLPPPPPAEVVNDARS